MSFLTRKVSRAKWQSNGNLRDDEIQADAITADLKTTGNSLSFWATDGIEPADLQRVVLALATGLDRVDKIDIAWVDNSVIEKAGLTIDKTPGLTEVASLVDSHRDISRLDLVRLGQVALLLQGAINSDQHRRYNKKKVAKCIADAVNANLVPIEKLSPRVQADIKEFLET